MPKATHKHAQFWIEVPPLQPRNISRPASTSALKEKANDQSMEPNAKRKLPGQSSNSAPIKKPKLTHLPTNVECMKPNEEFPNGYFYCHQCNKRRDGTVGIQCTYKDTEQEDSKTKSKRTCSVKFCKPCLKNRYGRDIDDIMQRATTPSGHLQHDKVDFKCPKCEGVCNCARCRKSKGLEPTGNLTFVVRRNGGDSVAEALAGNINMTGIVPGKGAQKHNFMDQELQEDETASEGTTPAAKNSSTNGKLDKSQAKTAHHDNSASHRTNGASKASSSKDKVEKPQAKASKPKPKPKKIPPPLLWNAVPTSLSLQQAEDRLHIREFMLRFASIMNPAVPKTYLDELEELDTSAGDAGQDSCPAWVSDICLRAILLGMLCLFQSDKEPEVNTALMSTMRDLKAAGVNLNKFWACLANLRSHPSVSDGHDVLAETLKEMPDPLPPPFFHNIRTTRSAVETEISLVSTSQFVPVIAFLVERSLQTTSVRFEIEEGVQEGKDDLKDVRECIKKEKDRWEAQRATLEESKGKENVKDKEAHALVKSKRNEHRQIMANLENARTVMQYDFIPRFSGLLGKYESRTFFVLSPGQAERQAAVDFVKAISKGRKEKQKAKGRGREKWSDEERSQLRDWSWFVAVYGDKPDDALEPPLQYDDDGNSVLSDLDEDEDRWWGFHDVGEIQKLAKWVSIKAGIDDSEEEDAPVVASDYTAKAIVDGLKSFAELLEWRIKRGGR